MEEILTPELKPEIPQANDHDLSPSLYDSPVIPNAYLVLVVVEVVVMVMLVVVMVMVVVVIVMVVVVVAAVVVVVVLVVVLVVLVVLVVVLVVLAGRMYVGCLSLSKVALKAFPATQ
jgi:hypothetical protein